MGNDLSVLGNPLRDVKKEFDQLVIPYRPALWSYCRSITGSPWDAEDLVQETLLKAFSSLSQLWQPLNTKAYLFRIASNTWIDYCRKQKMKLDTIEDLDTLSSDDSDIGLEINDAMEMIVSLLPPRQRVVFLLIEAFQFKAKEVAEMIGTTEGAVKAALNRARWKMKNSSEKQSSSTKKVIPVEDRKLIETYIHFFNNRDTDGMAGLLVENVSNDIVHIAQEYGKDTLRKNSLADWAKDPVEMTAELYMLWDKPTIVQVTYMDGKKAVYDLNLFDIEDGKIARKKDYYFCPDILQAAAQELNLKVYPREYQF
ncbi:RNA polymerase sigma-70 factor (ECF subfamily) [Salirhabdus euzebyi]|uniref:RNA polymerase sigma factor n=1 Tax=Salirhabdus euzebyi TaxID=394506 RepID=A0A841PTB8_9BACI|nr:sigma-70 family RNA polymerase sigma factor [Salirhabdus euzebyi]MBB6452069.1 RNA polymerase sigma-70 factor (ECF subfamily) [Salirhabdus euzebyi]